jgi:lipopolysaccharide/colanic/teichoic acid biosynthesis glycosyltransferase
MAQQPVWPWFDHVPLLTAEVGRDFYFNCKRAMDVVLSACLLVLLSPLILLIAVLIKLDTPGPVFFVQERVGSRRESRAGRAFWVLRKFRLYKFRSMLHKADQSLHETYIRDFVKGKLLDASAGSKRKLTNDSRVTRVGRLLRKTSLDELPQLWNVLKGDMSLVGPRPVPEYEVELYEQSHYERLTALPGITGLWQVKGRGQVSFQEMVSMDVDYARRASFWLDLKLLALTIPAVLRGRGAE